MSPTVSKFPKFLRIYIAIREFLGDIGERKWVDVRGGLNVMMLQLSNVNRENYYFSPLKYVRLKMHFAKITSGLKLVNEM